MRKYLLPTAAFVLIAGTITAQQKKAITYEQAFKSVSTNITKQTPFILKWIDDDHYLVMEKNDKTGELKNFSVDVKTGLTTEYVDDAKIRMRNDLKLPKGITNLTYSPDEASAAYTFGNNLYVISTTSQQITQLTFDGNDSIMNGYASWVYYEEILGRPSRYKAFWWSNDSKQIVFMHFDDSKVPIYPIYVSTGQHGYNELTRYPKVGDPNPAVKIGIADITTATITWANFNEKDDQYFGQPYFTPNNQLWVPWINRGQDNLKIFNVNMKDGSVKELYDEKQKTWIDLEDKDRIEFLKDGSAFIMKSDKTGWAQYYLYSMDGKLLNPITQGEFTVKDLLRIDEKQKTIYFTARKENSARYDVYMATLDGKKLNRLSFGEYSFTNIMISPNGKYFFANYSNISTPTVAAIMDNKGKVVRELGNAKAENYDAYQLPKKEIIRVKSDDGLFNLPVSITYPSNFDASKKYPVLVSIYGGPNAGTVYDTWRLLPNEIWWAQEGLIQVAIDNRSSGHFGKMGMNFIHRQLGKYEIEDYMTVGRWLKQQPWMDTAKLCITGGSFGGYMTCMALTYGASVFNYGIANSSVTDWLLYDTHYTERFMDQPSENPEGYKQTAVLTYANQYKGLLRIVHGTSDDNVHMQNSIQLINKLEDLKKHFEFMLYPGERHGIGGAKGLHNRTEAYKFYYDNLLNKPMPTDFWK
jgi:dipeptidyl-peptidase-4